MTTKSATNRLRSVDRLGQYVDGFYEEARTAQRDGKPMVWCDGYPLPFPILRAMDIRYQFGDAYAATVAARHQGDRLLEIAADGGYLAEVCSYTRMTMGMALMSDEERAASGPMYQVCKPDMIIVADPGCSMLVNWGEAERQMFDVPLYVLQIPHPWNGEADYEWAIAETARQLRDMIGVLEDRFHRTMDWDHLRNILVGVKEAATYRKEALDLSKHIPAPATFFDIAASLGGVNYLLGKPECAEFYRDMRDEMLGRVQNKEGAVLNEKYRLHFDGIMCWPRFGYLARKFAELGANIVSGRYTHLGFYNKAEVIDPDKPLESLAANGVSLHGNQTLDWLIDNIIAMCEEHHIDGLVMHATQTCRPLAGPQLEILDAVQRKLGIPGIFFEADQADESYYSDAQIDTRVQGLLEAIDAKRRRSR